MVWSLSTASVLGVTAAVVSGVLALFSWRHRGKRMALPFLLIELNLVLWSLAYAVQLGYGTLVGQLLWQRVTLGVSGFIPTVWFLFTFAYTGRESWLSKRRVALLTAESTGWLLLCLTNPLHGLVWTDATLTSTALGPVTALQFGVGYAVHIAYAYAVVALGLGLLVLHATRVARAYQAQVGLLVAGALPPFLAHILFTLGLSPVPGLDLTPFAFVLTGVVFGLALFQFDLLHLTPIAREQAFDVAGDGLLIVNEDGEVIDVIGVATAVLSPAPQIGDRIEDVFPETDLDALDGSETSATLDGEQRVYQFQVSSLSVQHDSDVGSLVIVRDITGLHESRQRLSVSNRVLRHNLRNDMNVILGHAVELENCLDDPEAPRAIRQKAEHLLELTRKAEQIANVHSDPHEGDSTELGRQLRAVVRDVQTTHPDVQFSLDIGEDHEVENVDPETFRLAVQNVIDNAVRHNGSETPEVHVRVTETETEVRVEIADNGPGIPEIEQSAVGAKTETQLDHSQGLGLWLTYWCATGWGGDLAFDADEDGTTVTLTVPRSGESRAVPTASSGGAQL